MRDFFDNIRKRIRPVAVKTKQHSSPRFDTSDVVQEMMVQIWNDIGDVPLNEELGESVEEPSPSKEVVLTKSGFPVSQAWLNKIAQGTVAKQLRFHNAKKRSVNREENLADAPVASEPTPEQAAVVKEQMEIFEKAIEELPEPSRSIVVLRMIKEVSFTEITRETGLSVSKVRKHYKKGMSQIRNFPGMEPG